MYEGKDIREYALDTILGWGCHEHVELEDEDYNKIKEKVMEIPYIKDFEIDDNLYHFSIELEELVTCTINEYLTLELDYELEELL